MNIYYFGADRSWEELQKIGFRRRNTCILKALAESTHTDKVYVVRKTTRSEFLRQLFKKKKHSGKVQDIIFASLLPERSFGKLSRSLNAFLLRRLCSGARPADLIWTYWPKGYFTAISSGLKGTIVFDADHNIIDDPSLSPADRPKREEDLLEIGAGSRFILSSTRSMLDWFNGRGFNKGVLLRNGVDTTRFQPMPPAGHKETFTIGYCGTLSRWIDYELFAGLARRNPQWNFLIIGKPYLTEDWRVLENLPNVHLLGEKTAAEVAEARAVVTIAAPCDPTHVTGLFKDRLEEIAAKGEVQATLAGRQFRISRDFVDDLAEHKLMQRIANLRKALLIFHSPTDEIVAIDNASRIFAAAKHPKSFVSLAGADHLLSRRSDAAYVADVIHAWAERYLEAPQPASEAGDAKTVVVRETGQGRFQQEVTVGTHRFLADEPVEVGGLDSGPGPYDLLLAGLGACTAMTLRLYAERKALPLERVTVRLNHSRIHATDCADCETKEGMLDRIDRAITLRGALDAEQRRRLLEIADKCPVHRTLTSEIDIRTVEQREG